MDLNEALKTIDDQRLADSKTAGQMCLGELISKLEGIADKKKQVQFEFEYLHPTCFQSYRGYYSDLAIGFDGDGVYPNVEKVLIQAKDCIGKAFEGYKGGYYTMHEATPIWVANWGKSGGTGVVGVRENEYTVFLETAIVDDLYR